MISIAVIITLSNFVGLHMGGSKQKLVHAYAIKRQACCIANTVRWSKNIVQLF